MCKRYVLSVLLCLPVIAVTGESGFCKTSSANPTLMDEVVVSESRIAESKKTVTANLSIISRETIEQSASRDLGELLTESGLGHIQKYPGALTSIGIRGFRTDTHGNDLQGKVLILLDGRRAGSGNVVKIQTRNIERVEIIRGPGAVQYGSAGIGGVVNVITRTGTSNTLYVEGGAGSFEKLDGSIGGTVFAHGFDFSGALNYLSSGDYDIGNGPTYNNSGIDNQLSTSLHGGYSFSDNHRLGVIFTGFDVEGAGNAGYLSNVDLDDYSDKSNFSLDTNYTGSSTDKKSQWMARFFFGSDENTWESPTASNPDFWDTGIPSKNLTDQLGAQAQYSTAIANHTITAGFDWINYEIENTYSPEVTDYSNPALFLLGKGSYLGDTLIANFGIRYDWFEVEVKEPVGRSESQTHLTPKLGLAWLANGNTKIRAQYAQGFMMPSADQLALDTVTWGQHVVGNPDLDPEQSQTYEAGVDYNRNSFTGSVTYFHTAFEDKIVTSYLSDGSRSWDNVGDATIAGLELEAGYDIGEPMGWLWELRPYLSATFLTEHEDEETGEDLKYLSDTNLSAGVVTSDGNGTFCRLNFSYYSNQTVTDWESGLYPAPDFELPSVTVADLTAAWKFLENEQYGSFTLKGDIQNLLDEKYAFVKGYPMPGISFFLGLRWDY
jgi:vitamin B12 transporter